MHAKGQVLGGGERNRLGVGQRGAGVVRDGHRMSSTAEVPTRDAGQREKASVGRTCTSPCTAQVVMKRRLRLEPGTSRTSRMGSVNSRQGQAESPEQGCLTPGEADFTHNLLTSQ